jgi:RNA polymerase sigma-70 factor (ECF subfamily)
MAYLGCVGVAPIQSIATTGPEPAAQALDRDLAAEFWRESGAAKWNLERDGFAQILLEVGRASNFGLDADTTAGPRQQADFLHGLHLADLALARACAAGCERAWEQFLVLYRQPLTRAAIAIAGNETAGRDLADQLYAEIYGLAEHEGQRRCPLLSYRGRGSLLGWLRATLAQRRVDQIRRGRREEPLDELDAPAPEPAAVTPPAERTRLENALAEALAAQPAEERYLLAAYFLDGQTLLQIARVLAVHEATVSRKLHRATNAIRKQVLKNLQGSGLSRRAAEEALGADPRDLNLNLKKLLQNPRTEPFTEQAAP